MAIFTASTSSRRNGEHGLQTVFVRVAPGSNSCTNGGAEAAPFIVVREKPSQPFEHLRRRSEIDDRFAVVTEDFPMLFRVFGEHAGSHRGNLERAHRVAVAVRSAHKAKRHLGSSDRFSQRLGTRVATSRLPRL